MFPNTCYNGLGKRSYEKEVSIWKHLLSIAFALLAGLMMSRLVKRWHLPAVTAYLVAGVLIGPNCLDFWHSRIGFASFDYVASFSLICDVALGFIAFSIGNEFRLSALKPRVSRPPSSPSFRP